MGSAAAASALLLAAALALGAGGPSLSRAEEAGEAAFRSATVCRGCHPEIYRTWRGSHHASAFTGPAFQLPYDRIRRSNPRAALPCEQCHNPMRFHLPPGSPRAAIFAQEGVTCEFCHTAESVAPGGDFPRYRLRAGVIFGPKGDASGKDVHRTRFSRLIITADFCAGCHELRNEYGVPILSTYSEWAESFYRGEGIHCQFCHLPELFDARFIDRQKGQIKGPPDHAMVGGHSRERLARAIPLRAALAVTGTEARLTIRLKNETVGHRIPSGIPTHRIRLVSILYDEAGEVLGRQEQLFERVLGDGSGKPLERPELIFTAAREVLKDNRLGPKEAREITQVFPLGGARPATADVSVTYEILTPDIAPDLRWLEIPISRVVVAGERAFPAVALAAVALAAAAVLLLGIAFLFWRNRRARP